MPNYEIVAERLQKLAKKEIEPKERESLREKIAEQLIKDDGLNPNGTGYEFYEKGSIKHFVGRADMLKDRCLKMVRLCLDFISNIPLRDRPPRKSATRSIPTSYTYKHVVENFSGQYIWNGAFILAARISGLKERQSDPNPYFNIDMHDARDYAYGSKRDLFKSNHNQ